MLTRPEREKISEKQVQHFKGNREIQFDIRDVVYVKDYKYLAKLTLRKAIIKN